MKKYLVIMLVMTMCLVFVGCTTSKSYTYTVDTGDKIRVEMNTTGGYDISSKLPFTISKKEDTATQGTITKTLSQGKFIHGEYYEQYVEAAKSDEKATVIDAGSNDSIEYVFWEYDNSEYNYVIKVKGTNTGILLGNTHSKEEAVKCFSLLTITADK